jgi:hypothetical protein
MAGFGGGWDAPTPPNFGNAALVGGSLTIVGPSGPYTSLFPAGATNILTSGEAAPVYDMGGAIINIAGPKYRAIGTWDPVAGTGDYTAALQQAIADLPALGGTIYHPPGTYRRGGASPISITGSKDVTLEGSSQNATRIQDNGGPSPLIKLGTGIAAGDFTGKLTITHLWLDGNGANIDLIGQYNMVTQPGRMLMVGVRFWNFGTGYAFHDAINNVTNTDSLWLDCKTSFGGTGININNADFSFHNCTFDHMTTGIALLGNAKTTLYSVVFSTNVTSISFAGAGVVYADSQKLDGCWFEIDSSACIASANTANQIDLVMDNCKWTVGAGNYHAFFDVTSSQILIRNSEFTPNTPKVYLRNSNNILRSEGVRAWNYQGVIATPFNNTNSYIGPNLQASDTHATGPTTAIWYRVQACEGLILTSTGGTVTAIDIGDKFLGSTTTLTGTTLNGYYLPIGSLIRWTHTGVPTVKAWPV